MVHIFKYVRDTKYLPLIISADNIGMLKFCIDVSHAVHSNMSVHTGGGMTMGQGFPISVSIKHNLNTRSSTESEIVRVD